MDLIYFFSFSVNIERRFRVYMWERITGGEGGVWGGNKMQVGSIANQGTYFFSPVLMGYYILQLG